MMCLLKSNKGSLLEFVVILSIIICATLAAIYFHNFFVSYQQKIAEVTIRDALDNFKDFLYRFSAESTSQIVKYDLPQIISVSVENNTIEFGTEKQQAKIQITLNLRDANLGKTKQLCIVKGKRSILLLKKCPYCDLNGVCSPSECKSPCPDCSVMQCAGDGYCNDFMESCANSPDCICPSTYSCCPDDPLSDYRGCSPRINVGVGGICYCNNQCNTSQNLYCSFNHCCPQGTVWNGTACAKRVDVLIVSINSTLHGKYTNADIQQLENKIRYFINVLNTSDSLTAKFIYLDSSEVSKITGGSPVFNPSDWKNIDDVIEQLYQRLGFRYLIIIGGHNILPQAINPMYCLATINYGTDDVYADMDHDCLPDIAFGRVPDPLNGDISVILNALDTYINLHQNGGIRLDTYRVAAMDCCSQSSCRLTCSCPSGDEYNWCTCKGQHGLCNVIFGGSCSGNCNLFTFSQLSGYDLAIVLAHGPGGGSSSDLLLGGYIHALGNINQPVTPSAMSSISVKNSTWFSMACGGGGIDRKANTLDSFVMTFLKQEGAIFIGSTDNNYAVTCPSSGTCIGGLYTEILEKVNVGIRLGDAYIQGKKSYLQRPAGMTCGSYTGYLVHINCFYGDPTLKVISKGW